MRRELGIARCGLACCLCSENVSCRGCDSGDCPDVDWCENRKGSIGKGIKINVMNVLMGLVVIIIGIFTAAHLLGKIKPYGFTLFIRRYGLDMLLDCLERNERRGIVYHREGISGDYDDFDDVEELIGFILTGQR